MKGTSSVQQSLFPEDIHESDRLSTTSAGGAETYRVEGESVVRAVRMRTGEVVESTVPRISSAPDQDPADEFDQSWLRATSRPSASDARGTLRMVDLFCGAGGMAVGFEEAARALAFGLEHALAADVEPEALATYVRNFSPQIAEALPIQQVIDSPLGAALSVTERELRRRLGRIDIVVGGPPCQGHSDLNNHTRRQDPKNALYDRMARFAEVVEPAHVIIENVPGVRHDHDGVYHRTIEALSRLGYNVDAAKVPAERLGVPQRRHRALVVASQSPIGEGFLRQLVGRYSHPLRSVRWAIEDLLDRQSPHPFDAVTEVSQVSRERIDWLFDNDEYDLPDDLRPDCHRTKSHTYKSVYGRLYWDQPAWTITTGFQVMGQGRFLHPVRRRVITSHEAARLQFFPDFFDFGVTNRKGYAKMIGNAVPSKLAYVLGLELLR
jgi:DNA (cytosine-5)-methyltransferase 1